MRTTTPPCSRLRLPGGNFLAALVSLGVVATASAVTRYVWQGSPSPAAPYTNWTTAAHVIQDAVDVAQTGRRLVQSP